MCVGVYTLQLTKIFHIFLSHLILKQSSEVGMSSCLADEETEALGGHCLDHGHTVSNSQSLSSNSICLISKSLLSLFIPLFPLKITEHKYI